MAMKIGLNLLHARADIGGGWTYIAGVIKMLTLFDSDWEFVAYCTSASAPLVPSDHRFTVKIINLPASSQLARIAYEQCVLPFIAYLDKVDCIHWFANSRSLLGVGKSVVTIHDFKFMDRPAESAFWRRLYSREMTRFACRRADALVPVSESTAQSATRLVGVDHNRMFVVPNPIDHIFRPASDQAINEFRERFSLPPQFWLYVAHPYKHKNHARLFLAYKRLRESYPCTWPLILRGDRSGGNRSLDEQALNLGIAGSVVWLPRLSTEDMARLYSAATAMVFPSLYEGCGIPVLEAMACGCPVVGSDIVTTQEFAGEAALMFDAGDVESITGAMHQIWLDAGLSEAGAAKGRLKAAAY
jgi:glycosyltransferase involved in cell wall biosynthesis